MWRVIMLLVAALFVADATGLLAESDDDIECQNDPGKRCPPTCPTCACAWHTMKTAPAPAVVVETIHATTRLLELPAVETAHGQLAPPPSQRPPIV